MKSNIRHIFILTLSTALLTAGGLCRNASAQALADSLRKAYDFKGAVEWSERALEHVDSSFYSRFEQELILSQNGLNMTRYCSQPEVVAQYRFSLEDFFLYYPMENGAWRRCPNVLDSLAGPGDRMRATYVPRDAEEIYYSARDADGIRNLYRTARKDSALWSVPQLINEELTSAADEIFPFLTRDGKSLYFASNGLYGMGGFDLYVSRWNEDSHDWDAPVNLGFPYSSPYDDFLFVNSDDGQYSVFASNRACSPDSVVVYVLNYDSMPVRKEVSTVDALKELCALTPRQDRQDRKRHAASLPEDGNVAKYRAAMDRVRLVRDSIALHQAGLERLRTALKDETDAARQATLRQEILSGEIALPARQKQLSQALKELQQIEMDFLANGIVIDPDKLQAEADREVIGTASSYVFSKNEFGPALQLTLEKPEPRFDYSFKILDVGQFAEDDTLPDGLVYQIQLFASTRKATERELKGLSPVFHRIGSGGKHVYSAGLFRSYADVLSQLNKVKGRGFKGAMIVAFDQGKMISIPNARALEARTRNLYAVRIWPEDGQNLSEAALTAIHSLTDKDIIRTKDGAAQVYEVGPFSDRQACERLVGALREAGVSQVSVTEIEEADQKDSSLRSE